MTQKANASPTKKFFIDMLTRDIDLEDAILDLVDNSIDALLETYGIAISSSLLNNPPPMKGSMRKIEIKFDEKGFKIKDDCGGIPYEKARDEVFRFGHIAHEEQATLGVYGIGLKRAIFKIGKVISISSKAAEDGFSLDIDVEDWVKDDNKKKPDWTFPIEETGGARSKALQGTTIEIKNLLPQIVTRIKSATLEKRVIKSLALTYSLFLDQYVALYVNGRKVEPEKFELSESDDVASTNQSQDINDVNVQIVAGLASKPWTAEKAGWYVICNGRVVVAADKSDLTGWGPQYASFHSKFRGFLGIIFFFSTHPEQLPWTTTKRGINRESEVFQRSLIFMANTTRSVLAFLNSMYPTIVDEEESPVERLLVERTVSKQLSQVTAAKSDFRVLSNTKKPVTVSVQFRTDPESIKKAARALGNPNLSAREVGKQCLEYFLEQECS